MFLFCDFKSRYIGSSQLNSQSHNPVSTCWNLLDGIREDSRLKTFVGKIACKIWWFNIQSCLLVCQTNKSLVETILLLLCILQRAFHLLMHVGSKQNTKIATKNAILPKSLLANQTNALVKIWKLSSIEVLWHFRPASKSFELCVGTLCLNLMLGGLGGLHLQCC